MDITKILNTNRVILDMQAANKAEVIEELTNLLKRGDVVNCRETLIKDIWQRKVEGSTGPEDRIATSHGKSLTATNTTLIIGRTRQDIPWETPDGNSARCIVLFAVHLEDQNTTRIRLLSQVAGALADDNVIEQLLVETSPQKVIDPFNQYTQSNVF